MNLFDGPGTARATARALDWAATPLGKHEEWSPELRHTVRLTLSNGLPACVLWGPEYVGIYNDAMAVVFAAKHPGVMGLPSRKAWPEAWATNEPIFAKVMQGETVTVEDAPYMSERNGPREQMTITISFSPIIIERGQIGGVLCTMIETTAENRARLLAAEREELIEELEVERERAEEERVLATSVLESMNDCYFTLDSDFRLTFVNRAMERVVGMMRESLIGQSLWDVFPSTQGGDFERNYRQALKERSDVHFTSRYSSESLNLLAEVDAYPTESGGLAVFWRDVTQQTRDAMALVESEARFRAVQDAAPAGSTLYRPVRDDEGTIVDFEVVYINTAGARMAGAPKESLVGKTLLEMFPHAIPNGVFEKYVQAMESGVPVEWEARDMREGVNLGVHFIAVLAGELLHVRYADITERMRMAAERETLLEATNAAYAEARTAEAKLRDVFEQAPVAIAVMTGPEHVYTIVSPRYAESPGGGRPLLGRSVREAFPEVAGTGFFELMDQVYETGEPYRSFERKVHLQDAKTGEMQELWFNIGYQPLRNAQGTVYAIASAAYDVTDQIRARQEVEAAREGAEAARVEAEAANKAKGEFLAVMSHELRTPLNAIGGYAELIEIGVHGPTTDAQRVALGRIQQSQRHLLGLINGVLNYSRVEAGAVTYSIEPVPVLEAVMEAESLVAPQLRARGLEYHWAGCQDDLWVMVDREKLQQILLNLLSNAIKFTDARDGKPGRIDASCELLGGEVHIHVRDTGEGIEAGRLLSVFEPFVQIDQRLTRRQEGVGLGLTISRDLARGMGGDLIAASTLGEGSVFTLVLPRA
ncbi:MAG: PAS domain-containing protein [Gemmatimonadota bacterium]